MIPTDTSNDESMVEATTDAPKAQEEMPREGHKTEAEYTREP